MSPQWRDPVFLSPENQLPVFSGAGGALGQGQGVGGVTRVSLLLRQTFGQSYVFSPSVAPAARCRFLARGFKSANQVGFQLSHLTFWSQLYRLQFIHPLSSFLLLLIPFVLVHLFL